jgi:hypothetical protein
MIDEQLLRVRCEAQRISISSSLRHGESKLPYLLVGAAGVAGLGACVCLLVAVVWKCLKRLQNEVVRPFRGRPSLAMTISGELSRQLGSYLYMLGSESLSLRDFEVLFDS